MRAFGTTPHLNRFAREQVGAGDARAAVVQPAGGE
jgi:hypothetical protein